MVEPLDLKKWKEYKGKFKIDFVYEMRELEYHCTANEGEYLVLLRYFPEKRKPKNLFSFDLSVFDADLVAIYIAETEYELEQILPTIILSTHKDPKPKEIIKAMEWEPPASEDDIFTQKF
jgi:hypothetical protein